MISQNKETKKIKEKEQEAANSPEESNETTFFEEGRTSLPKGWARQIEARRPLVETDARPQPTTECQELAPSRCQLPFTSIPLCKWSIVAGSIVVGLIAVVVYYIVCYWMPYPRPDVKSPKTFLEDMKKNYPSQKQDEFRVFLKQIVNAKKSHINTHKSVVVTLLHYNTPEIAIEISKEMAHFAALWFHSSFEIFSLNGLDISSEYFEQNLKLIKSKLNETGTFLVTNFEAVPSDAAKFFHMICDKYTPFIYNEAVYILVLKTDKNLVSEDDQSGWKKCAASTMTTLWSDLDNAVLDALIVRLTEDVIKIYPENK